MSNDYIGGRKIQYFFLYSIPKCWVPEKCTASMMMRDVISPGWPRDGVYWRLPHMVNPNDVWPNYIPHLTHKK